MDPSGLDDAMLGGSASMWLAMTLMFEFGAGHYLFRTPWSTLLADYNLLAGRLWILVLVATLTAPALVYLAAHNPGDDAEISSPASDDTPRPLGKRPEFRSSASGPQLAHCLDRGRLTCADPISLSSSSQSAPSQGCRWRPRIGNLADIATKTSCSETPRSFSRARWTRQRQPFPLPS